MSHDFRILHERHFCLSFGVHASQTLHNHHSFCHSSSALRSAAVFHHVLLSYDAPLDEVHHWDMSAVNTTSCTNEAAKKACTETQAPVPRPFRDRLNGQTEHLAVKPPNFLPHLQKHVPNLHSVGTKITLNIDFAAFVFL